jgi:phosphoribosylformimino-5-aminoimidazole carboxamide ribotide isomerase/phosphoribosyl-ATP pyrophosphohydrolase/phosphoribosyl-AMP cyclohydrolase
MQTPEKDGAVLPLIIEDTSGELLAAGLTNTKGYQKSLEQGNLWTLDGETGRLLPLEGSGQLQDIRREAGYLRAVVTGFQGDSNVTQAPEVLRGPSNHTQNTPNPDSGTPLDSANHETNDDSSETSDTSEVPRAPRYPDPGQVLAELEALIQERKRSMPEGSYTTHLFSKGEDKIRKKAGEEAVEILLAKSDEELVSESADFLYHLMVLYVQRGIDFSRIFQELASR